MAFVFRTRLRQYGDIVNGVPVVRDPAAETTLWTSAVNTVVATVPAAMELVPAGSRPPEAEWFLYRLEWRVQSSVVPDIRGVVPGTGRLVFDVDFWDTPAARAAAPTVPQRRCTFRYEFTSARLAGAPQAIRAEIDNFLLRAHFGNYQADFRDVANGGAKTPTYSGTDPALDPLGLSTRQAITDLDGVPIDLAARWRTGEG